MSSLNYKIVLIGNSSVGKTALFRKIETGEFYDRNISTIGIGKKTLYMDIEEDNNGKKIKKNICVSLYDTAGQEKYKATTLNYFKGADGIILMYDITNRGSFDNIEEWINSIKESIGNAHSLEYIIMLIGNKLDLVDEDEQNRTVKEDEAEDICHKFNMIWGGEISIKNIKYDDLIKLFNQFIEKIYKIIGEKYKDKQKLKAIKNYKNIKERGCC
jgi:small GTP-binding protein